MTRLTLRLKAEEVDKALRRTVLQIVCDGYPWGQVCSPAGDFFGAAPGINPYRSLPFTVEADGEMICRYVMPFRKNMRIELENRGGGEVAISGEAVTSDYAWNDRSMHFRARWRADHNIIASNREVQDIPFLLANGKGVYVGTTSLLLNPSSVPTPWGNWWGEGDEKVFVDADTLPSLFGTGSEDYYNYSWSSPDIFYFPYCGQPRNDGPGNRGFVSNYRWHILDPIPFRENIAFYMELFSHERTPGFSYARIGYCYARPGLRDDFRPISTEDLRELAPPGQWHPEPRFGARNSEFYPAEKVVRNRSATRTRRERLCADGAVLVWTPKRRGERKTFALPVKESGVKKIFITALLSPRSGAFKVYLDGRELTEGDGTIDLYRPHRTLLRNFGFPQTELRKGAHILTLEYVGAGRNLTSPEIGIDFFWIQSLQ